MKATQLLSVLRKRGFSIHAEGEHLVVSPASALSDELREAIRSNKAELFKIDRYTGLHLKLLAKRCIRAKQSHSTLRFELHLWLSEPHSIVFLKSSVSLPEDIIGEEIPLPLDQDRMQVIIRGLSVWNSKQRYIIEYESDWRFTKHFEQLNKAQERLAA